MATFMQVGTRFLNLDSVRQINLRSERCNYAKPSIGVGPLGNPLYPKEDCVTISFREFPGATDEWCAESHFFGEDAEIIRQYFASGAHETLSQAPRPPTPFMLLQLIDAAKQMILGCNQYFKGRGEQLRGPMETLWKVLYQIPEARMEEFELP